MNNRKTIEISWWRTDVGNDEIDGVVNAIRNENLSQGSITAAFEARLAETLGVPHVMMTPNGSSAILMAMLAIGIEPGDEVIVPAYSWIASAHGAFLLGARIVLADTRPDLPLLDVDAVREKITPNTRAVVAVHLNGCGVHMEGLKALAAEHGLQLVEDACQAFTSKGPLGNLGTLSDVGCFSLGVTKLITTGQGGFVATRSETVFEALTAIKRHGVITDADGHETYRRPGLNFNYTDIQAAIGLSQLDRIEGRREQVLAVHERYAPALHNLPYLEHLTPNLDNGELPLWVMIATPRREVLVPYLAANGIQSQRLHPPLNEARHLDCGGVFPNARRFGEEGLVLPSGPAQPVENIDRVIGVLGEFGAGLERDAG